MHTYPTIHPFTLIAVRTQHLNVGWETLFDNPSVKTFSNTVNFPLSTPVIVDVVEN